MPLRAISRGRSPDICSSPSSTRPPARGAWPVMAFTSVVLPEPFGPIKPTISPDDTDRLTRSSARRPENSTDTSAAMSDVVPMAESARQGRSPGGFTASGCGNGRGAAPAHEGGLSALQLDDDRCLVRCMAFLGGAIVKIAGKQLELAVLKRLGHGGAIGRSGSLNRFRHHHD